MDKLRANSSISPPVMTADAFDRVGGVRHAFTTRLGGVSGGIFSSLNLGVRRGDDENAVRENYRIICGGIGIDPKNLVFSRQTHSDIIRTVTAADSIGDIFAPVPYEADGLITDLPGLPLIVFVADCEGILLYDPVKRVVAAVHAGWRGTAADIAGKAVAKMKDEFGCDPRDILAALAPCIGSCCYEVGPDVYNAAAALGGIDVDSFFAPGRADRLMMDLRGMNAALLMAGGISDEHITVSDECTMCKSDIFWSHRASKGNRGSQACIIMLEQTTVCI